MLSRVLIKNLLSTEYLLKKGFDLHAKTKAGKTVLDLASNDEMRSLLSDHEKAKQTEPKTGDDKAMEKDKYSVSDSPLEGEKAEAKGVEECSDETSRKTAKNDVPQSPPKPKKRRR